MNTYQEMFPHLTLISDIDWEKTINEFLSFSDLTFPDYLELKSQEGDCPSYLVELAYYEMALFELKKNPISLPQKPGIYLNSTVVFLNLEFDIKKMIEDANQGDVIIFRRPHYLCLFKNKLNKISSLEIKKEDLKILQYLENGPKQDLNFLTSQEKNVLKRLKENDIILDVTLP